MSMFLWGELRPEIHNTKLSTHLAIFWILCSVDSAEPKECELF